MKYVYWPAIRLILECHCLMLYGGSGRFIWFHAQQMYCKFKIKRKKKPTSDLYSI